MRGIWVCLGQREGLGATDLGEECCDRFIEIEDVCMRAEYLQSAKEKERG